VDIEKCSRRPIPRHCKIALFHFLGDKKQRSLLAFATFTRPPPRSAHGARPRHDIASTRQRTCDSFPHSSAAAMQSGNTTGSGLAPAAHLRAASGGGATRRRPGAGRKQQRQDGGGRRRGERPAVVKPAGRTDQGEGDEDEDEDEEPARPVEAPKVPQAAPTNSYVTKTHTKYIKAAVVEAYKKQHAHDLPAGQDLATWAPKVVASGAVVREVVGMCQEKFPDKKAVFTEARVRKKYREKPKQARGGKGKGKGGGQGAEGGQSAALPPASRRGGRRHRHSNIHRRHPARPRVRHLVPGRKEPRGRRAEARDRAHRSGHSPAQLPDTSTRDTVHHVGSRGGPAGR
jgi:hypothetical protein